MKNIVISDIDSSSDSVIPFGLNLSKELETDVDILHFIDRRTHQGVNGPVADSQSITPETFSHDEIVKREISKAKRSIDVLLSGEASRLNYPLKANAVVKEDTLISGVASEIEKIKSNSGVNLLVASKNPDNTIINSIDEIIELSKNIEIPILLANPGAKFTPPKNILLITDFNNSHPEKIRKVLSLFSSYNPHINAVDIANQKRTFLEKKLKSATWKEIISRYSGDHENSKMNFSANILSGKNYVNTILHYLVTHNPDMILLLKSNGNTEEKWWKLNYLSQNWLINKQNKLIKYISKVNNNIPLMIVNT